MVRLLSDTLLSDTLLSDTLLSDTEPADQFSFHGAFYDE